MIEKPYEGRASIEQMQGSTTVKIPMQTSWFKVIFISFWLCFWAIGAVIALYSILTKDWLLIYRIGYALFIFIFFWLVAFSTGGNYILWELYGQEVIILDKKTLTIKSDVRFFSWKKIYYLNAISQMEVYYDHLHYTRKKGGYRTPGYNKGKIKFTHRKKTIRFGNGLSEPEAQKILDIFKESDYTVGKNFA